MRLADELKDIRQQCFLSQSSFAKELGVSFSTVNRWETGKSIPNCKMMKRIVQFCKEQGIDSKKADSAWKEQRNAIYAH